MKDFCEAGTFRKSNNELEKALNDPDKGKEMLEEAHGNGRKTTGDSPQIRIMGDIKKCIKLIQDFGLREQVSGIYKNYEDKDKRENFSSSNVRIYINTEE